MEKIYKELTEEQRERGVCFSSCFSTQRTEQTNEGTIHEVLNTMTEQEQLQSIKEYVSGFAFSKDANTLLCFLKAKA